MKTKNIVYICDGIGSVFQSQVMELLLGIKQKGVFGRVILILGLKNEEQKAKYETNINKNRIETKYFKKYPNYPFYNALLRREIYNCLKENDLLGENIIYHVRGERLSYFLHHIITKQNILCKIITDIRGTSIEEIKEYYKGFFLNKYLKIYNYKKFIKNTKEKRYITVVSSALKEYLINKHKYPIEHIVCTPCISGSDFRYDEKLRRKKRNELGIKYDEIVIVFSSGGTAGWQKYEILSKLPKYSNIKILNISPTQIDSNNIINIQAEYEEMPSLLNAADIGIIWRDYSIVNETALPVKFVEYICCGLPVIANNSVDSIIKYLDNNKHGVLIDRISDLSHQIINKLKLINRCEISQKGLEIFNVEKVVDKYLKLYEKIGL